MRENEMPSNESFGSGNRTCEPITDEQLVQLAGEIFQQLDYEEAQNASSDRR